MKRQRNILIFHCDQMRFDALGVNGHPGNPTPNLDRLAASPGTANFTRHIVANPVCMPSRASFFTGLYGAGHGVWTNGVPLPRREYAMANHDMESWAHVDVTPEPASFPPLKEAVAMILACGAIPMYAWLDGTSSGESDTDLLLDFFAGEAGFGLNIIPDRNWNLRDPADRARKVAKLNEIIAKARERNVPLCVGTEINNAVQPMVDHFDSPELRPHAQVFLDGALVLWGHSLLLRHGGFGYNSPQAQTAFRKDAGARNAFFREVGARPVPHGNALQTLRSASRSGDAKAVLRALEK